MATEVVFTLSDDAEADRLVEAMKSDNARIVYRPADDTTGWEELWPEIESIVSVEIRETRTDPTPRTVDR